MNIQGTDIEIVDSYRYLGVHLNNKLDWTINTQALMSSDIYAKPDLSKKVRYNRNEQENGAGWEEMEVDIYATVHDVGNNLTVFQSQEEGRQTQKHRALQKTLCRGVLCTVVLVVVVILFIYVLVVTLEVNQLKTKHNQLNNTYNQLLNNLSGITLDKDQLQKEHDQLIYTYNQLKIELDGECHEGWRRFGSSFYRKFTKSKTWSESRRECEKRGADLVIINSKEEQDFVGQLDTKETSWIGLKAEWSPSKQKFEWKWVDGSPLTTTFWAAGWSQHQYNKREYAALCCTNEGKLTHSLHTSTNNWICEKKIQDFFVES
ncbi:C-type lectin domain family 4 member A-like [Cololabis saira]|uniref:C-type lectin domain family 4 member A-like n=1 Tax=Cololabis saira TaxID=129043 RepID=UPI002AD347B3|nr:C-type lectin domain family 4 member A-like [Cololabis saira]